MIELKIEKGIEIPAKKAKGGSRYQPIVELMQVGDCVLLPEASMTGGFTACLRRRNYKFATRKDGEGMRIWRTE